MMPIGSLADSDINTIRNVEHDKKIHPLANNFIQADPDPSVASLLQRNTTRNASNVMASMTPMFNEQKAKSPELVKSPPKKEKKSKSTLQKGKAKKVNSQLPIELSDQNSSCEKITGEFNEN